MHLALLAAVLAATPVKLAVVELSAPPSLIGIADELTEDVLASARKQRLPALGPDEQEAALGETRYDQLVSCGMALSCVVEQLRPLGADRAVIGSLDRDAHDYRVRLWLVDLGQQQAIAAIERSIPIAAQRLREDVDAAVPALLRGEGEALGTLTIAADFPGTQVEIDGQDARPAPLTIRITPGEHQIHAELTGHLSVDRLANVEPGRTTSLALRMLAFPAARPSAKAVGTSIALVPAHAPIAAAPSAMPAVATARIPASAIVALAGAGLAAVGGLAFGQSAHQLEQRLAPVRQPTPWTETGATIAGHRRIASGVCFGLSALGLAAAGVLTYEANLGEAQARLSVGPRGVAIAGAF